jgi:hypothetical protein
VYIVKDTPSPVRRPHEPGSEKVDRVSSADRLIHDAMYTGPESGVARLLFLHHDPARTRDQLDAIVGGLRDRAGARGCPVDIEAATENTVIRMETLP